MYRTLPPLGGDADTQAHHARLQPDMPLLAHPAVASHARHQMPPKITTELSKNKTRSDNLQSSLRRKPTGVALCRQTTSPVCLPRVTPSRVPSSIYRPLPAPVNPSRCRFPARSLGFQGIFYYRARRLLFNPRSVASEFPPSPTALFPITSNPPARSRGETRFPERIAFSY